MDVLFELLIKLLSLTVIMVFFVGLLFVMLISVVYIVGYVYDSYKTVEKNATKRIIFAIRNSIIYILFFVYGNFVVGISIAQ